MYDVVKEYPLPTGDKVHFCIDGGISSKYDKTRMIPDRFTNPGKIYEVVKEYLLPCDCCFTPEHHMARMRPERFNHPNWFTGYGCQKLPLKDLMYRTTSDAYGWYPPNMDTFPREYFPLI
ncbi:uncharacterized protein [Anabrus simplex]|uniref:uncharacterized protein n=1 Tax=Anabrus simplex TaxID=316456 RepID=UPI0034DD392A